MKKIIAVILAVMMTLSVFAVTASAEAERPYLRDVINGYPNSVVVVFQMMGFKMGTKPGEGYLVQLANDDPDYPGEWAYTGVRFYGGSSVSFPTVVTSDDTQTAVWSLVFNVFDDEGNIILPAGHVVNPEEGVALPKNLAAGTVLVYRASKVTVQKESVLGKIIGVFAKIIKVMFGEDTAKKFVQMLIDMDLGLDLDIDSIFPPKTVVPENP